MPLDEISPNLIRSSTDRRCGSKENEVHDARRSFARPPPLAVAGMLRTDTEVGDIGVFAHRPRVPRSNTQSSFATQSRATASSSVLPGRYLRPAPEHHARSDVGGQQGFRRNGSVRSSISGYHYAPRTRRSGNRPLPHSRQYPTQRNLHSHRSLASLRSAAARVGPASPYFQPYRTASPAISNVYEYRHAHRSRNGSFRSDPASPGSIYTNVRSLHDYRLEHNASVASFRPLPSPLIGSNRSLPPRRMSISRTMTPVSVTRQYNQSQNTSASEPASPTESIVPFYYDYSESFHGRDALSSPEIPAMSNSSACREGVDDACIEADALLPLVGQQGTLLSPVELPIKHNRRPSEQSSRHSRKASSKSSRSIHVLSHQTIDEEVLPEHELEVCRKS